MTLPRNRPGKRLGTLSAAAALAALLAVTSVGPAVPGLPFSEDFSAANLRDAARTNARWLTVEGVLTLAPRQGRFGVFGPGTAGADISTDAHDTRSMVTGDLDGDGDLDLVAGNALQISRLYLNNGTANPWNGVTGSNVTSDTRDTRALALGDVDGDGDLDLVAGNALQANRLYLNNGTSSPFSGVVGIDITPDARDTRALALGDVDGDGDLDLVAGNALQANRLYLNNGTSSPFSGVVGIDITPDARDTRALALGDVDGDGDLDLVAGNALQTSRLYLSNGTANPWNGVAGIDVTPDAHDTRALALGDVDGDGDLDLVAGNAGQADRLYANNGTADPWNGVAGIDVAPGTESTSAVALGDVDGDGALDLVVGNQSAPNRLYLNNGTPLPWNGVAAINITSDSDDTRAVLLDDLDGDGDLDVAAGNVGRNRFYANAGSANPWEGASGADVSTDLKVNYAVAAGDVDNDGDLDVVTGAFAQTNRLYLNNGTANPWSGVTGSDITADRRQTRAVALGDVDSDGDLDFVAGNDTSPSRLYLNNGTASPWNGVTGSDITSDAFVTTAVALGDLDRDGDLDLVAGNEAAPNRLYLNNGTASPWNGVTGSNVTADTAPSTSLALGDVDRDGDLDLVVGNNGTTNRLYLNNGTAAPFSGVAGSNITADTDNTHAIALADVDRDGDLDLVAGGSFENRLYLNNGTADPFAGISGSDISSDIDVTRAVALADVDGDGDLDLTAGNALQVIRLYLNDGAGSPWDAVTSMFITTDSADTRGLAFGDFDGDGDQDLVAANRLARNRYYANPAQSFSWSGTTRTDIASDAHDTRALAFGDFDRDGDLDLVAGNDAAPGRLYLNNGTAAPFIGVTGTDVTGDASGTRAVALGDVDSDGDLDLVVGNVDDQNRLYLNNGTAAPFNGVLGADVTSDIGGTQAVALGDVDSDGDLDLVAGNDGPNRLYLNNGTADPWNGAAGSDITGDLHDTHALALGDVDADGDLDLVAGNDGPNRLYLNNGTAAPFNGVAGSDISADLHDTRAVALGDLDADGDLDLVAGNDAAPGRLYLNNGTAAPFNGVAGSDISADVGAMRALALADVDGDSDLDLVVGRDGAPDRLYRNSGTANPFAGVGGIDVSADVDATQAVALGDLDRDGLLDLVTGNRMAANRRYAPGLHHAVRGLATSLEVDAQTTAIPQAAVSYLGGVPPATWVDLWLSNNSGARWFQVQPGALFVFPTTGADLRWRMQLHSASPVLSPRIDAIFITTTAGCAPTPEVCDGADNDCDGMVDEGTNIPTTCGVGSCAAAGMIACVGGTAQPDTCSPGAPSAEACDGADNDCDGTIDDGTDIPTTCGVGSCAAAGMIACVGGTAQPDTCSPGAPSAEACDGADNDCDGTIDDGTDIPTTCGVGSCAAAGMIACVGGAAQPDTCSPGTPSAEACDGADNDCDGTIDDGTDIPTTCGVGSCAAAGMIACVGGAAQPDTCSPGTPSAEACDGADNDCDGTIDEGFDADGDLTVDCLDNCPADPNPLQTNADGDPFGAACECDDADASVYPGAPEINDGQDNQCPEEEGAGLSDEIGAAGFTNPAQPGEYSWTAQAGASTYEVARAASPDFSIGCETFTTADPSILLPDDPPPGGIAYLLVRPLLPFAGSWGRASNSTERSIPCGAP